MKSKKKYIFIIIILLLGGIIVYLLNENHSLKESGNNYENNKVITHENMISMMLETEAKSGNYEMTTRSEWPTEGYIFNSELSKCENGGELFWDDTNKRVLMSGNTSDKCYVYFDKIITLSEYVISQYDGVQGNNNIYYHNSSLTYGAKDNSYRFAGSSDTTHNYVCFGSNAAICPEDNLYRIIGTFNGKVKLIKVTIATSNLLGTDGSYVSDNTYDTLFMWSSLSSCPSDTTAYIKNENVTKVSKKNTLAVEIGPGEPTSGEGCNEWNYSDLNTINLNTNYLNTIGITWSNMIDDTTWKVSGHTTSSVTPSTMFAAEITNATKTYGPMDGTSKIGLIYASDYGYAASPSAWTTNLSSYNNSLITSVNWLYLNIGYTSEETLTKNLSKSGFVFIIANGPIDTTTVGSCLVVRPVFFLKSSVNYVSGSGIQSDPIRIS